jgi:UDP-glucose 4-epimerase
MKKILITGGAGYIGSHAVRELHRCGYSTIVLDNLSRGHRELVKSGEFIQGDLTDAELLHKIFLRNSIDAVMHFAAYAYVGESVEHPAKYYRNNVCNTLQLLEHMVKAGVDKMVFSSTCATYGVAQQDIITEEHPQRPVNPYGHSKLMVEQVLRDFGLVYGLRWVVFRYFNAAGADPGGAIGEWHEPETHLLPLVLDTAAGRRDFVEIYGTDYPTLDGTCIRDFIHVTDIARAHVLGLRYLQAGNASDVLNLGNGQGFSVLQVIEAVETITGTKVRIVASPRRPGDPARLVGSSEKARSVLGWQPSFEKLSQIVETAWTWHQKLHAEKEGRCSDLISVAAAKAHSAS